MNSVLVDRRRPEDINQSLVLPDFAPRAGGGPIHLASKTDRCDVVLRDKVIDLENVIAVRNAVSAISSHAHSLPRGAPIGVDKYQSQG